jgi:hypothetical protein
LQGEQCATITINITGVAFTPDYANFTAIAPITKTVCWYKPEGAEHAEADVVISTKGLCDIALENRTSELRMLHLKLAAVCTAQSALLRQACR